MQFAEAKQDTDQKDEFNKQLYKAGDIGRFISFDIKYINNLINETISNNEDMTCRKLNLPFEDIIVT